VTEERITITDVRRAGHCAAGARVWFEGHGIDFRVFLKNGIPVEDLLALKDGVADEVVRLTRERRRG
jgi:hypothetical protein